jgi:non-homologous end joining protein Ku
VLAQALQTTRRIAVGTFTWRGKTTPIAIRVHQDGLAGEEIQRVEVETRPPMTDLVATLKASLGRKPLAKAPVRESVKEPAPGKQPARRRRAS